MSGAVAGTNKKHARSKVFVIDKYIDEDVRQQDNNRFFGTVTVSSE